MGRKELEGRKIMKYKCCFCGREFNDWGNNPWPVKKIQMQDAVMIVIGRKLYRLE